MNISILTMIGMLTVIASNILDYLLNREKMTWRIRLVLLIVVVLGLVMVAYSNNDLNDDIWELQAEAEKLKEHVANLSKPAVEFVKGEQELNLNDSIWNPVNSCWYFYDSLWHTVYNFRTNPALHARDVKIAITCSDSIEYAACDRVSDKPASHASEGVSPAWNQKPFSFQIAVDFLAADETLRVVVKSKDSLGDPICNIETWSRRMIAAYSP